MAKGLLLNIWNRIYYLLSSVKLALALLVIILLCCFGGVTIYRGQQAWQLIFSTVWFNGLLVLLVVNVAFCFFPRMWGRKMTLVLAGMILFHLSFVTILCGIVYNSLYYFRGTIRLTEGEVLANGEARNYDVFDRGSLFDIAKLKGQITLIKMHRGYRIGGEDKRVAYEVAVGDDGERAKGLIYITHSLDQKGFSYFNDREGYSLLIMFYDRSGRELYGAHIPLQSLKNKDESYLYTTGTKSAPGSLPFPQFPLKSLFQLQASFTPTKIVTAENEGRDGDVNIQIWPLKAPEVNAPKELYSFKKVPFRTKVRVNDNYLSVKEIRYWVAISVRHEPGKPIVLASLWVGLAGIIITFIGRMLKKSSQRAVGG